MKYEVFVEGKKYEVEVEEIEANVFSVSIAGKKARISISELGALVEKIEAKPEVKAEVKAKEEKKGKGYYYQERRYSHFQRSFTLPTEVIPEKTEAKLKNGILELTLTKLKPSPKKKKRKIEIH